VQKSRLIEKIAELLTARKLPLLDDVRDESAEDIRSCWCRARATSIAAS
jgi:topoisomerase-4 subunit A